MSSRKMALLVKGLVDKTDSGEIDWELTNEDDVFQTSFPDYSIRLSHEIYYDIAEEPLDSYYVSIYNKDGALIDTISNYQLEDFFKAYTHMERMYAKARREALGIDRALDDLLAALNITGDVLAEGDVVIGSVGGDIKGGSVEGDISEDEIPF